jgi:hypothetical protein
VSIILRIDVDRPYGQRNILLKSLSKITSELSIPRITLNFYLKDLKEILKYLNDNNIRAYIFFRKITIPNQRIMDLITYGKHICGLHLENSRSFNYFINEINYLEKKTGRKIETFSKHGSGKYKYGLNHYVPYEGEKYVKWGLKYGIKLFFGNGEDPAIASQKIDKLIYFPSAFWLEPYWRDTKKYTPEWLIKESKKRDLVLLFHPDNVMKDENILKTLKFILKNSDNTVINN